MDRGDSLLMSFIAADVDEKAAISFDAFVQILEDNGFRFHTSDLEVDCFCIFMQDTPSWAESLLLLFLHFH